MNEPNDPALAVQFEENRARLRAVAYRMLGSSTEADDAVQEAWLRLSRAGGAEVENLGAWLTTVVARVCLDVLRSRKLRREESLESEDAVAAVAAVTDAGQSAVNTADQEMLLADSIGPALLVVLEMLAPAERIAFVLHDMFAVSFDEIAGIVGRSPAAARQLASRARRRVQGADTDVAPEADRVQRRELVGAFLTAARGGSFDALLAVLDPNVAVHADGTAVKLGSAREILGADAVANMFVGRAAAARMALVDGVVGAVWIHNRKPRVVFRFTVAGGKITAIELAGDRTRLAAVDLVVLEP